MKRTTTLASLLSLLSLLLLLLLISSQALAVSLGDELILSRLGDPVEVEIEVLQWEDMDLDRVEISAATREEYEVFELTWLPVLQDLDFNLVGPDIDGNVRVLISSREPLDEPFLELLLVLRWPGGSLRREYVLLFDPPGAPLAPVASPPREPLVMTVPLLPPVAEPAHTVGEQIAGITPAPTQPEPEIVDELSPDATVISVEEELVRSELVGEQDLDDALPEPQITDEPVAVEEISTAANAVQADAPATVDARTQMAIEVETLSPQAPVALDTTRRTYQVRSGDSLWNIARQFRPAGAGENLYQMLLGIHNLNRASFVNGNISLLKANAMLQIPSASDIAAVDAQSAEAEFDRRWEQGTQRFDAVVRGEAIPLFANEVPDEIVADVEDDLPPGTEAPRADSGDDALIMVSATNVPQPLQIASTAAADTTSTTEVAGDAAIGRAGAVAADSTPDVIPEPAAARTQVMDPGTATVQNQVRVITRAEFAAELEAQLQALNAQRQSAEAVAQQLQASLRAAQQERAARSSLLGTENLLLASGAVVLLVAMLAGIVVSLKIAGDLRLRSSTLSNASLDARTEPKWLNAQAVEKPVAERREPRMPAMGVVELPAVDAVTALENPSQQREVQRKDDLFARMDDLIGADAKPRKNS